MSNIATDNNAVETALLGAVEGIEAAELASINKLSATATPTMADTFKVQMDVSTFANEFNMLSTTLSNYAGQATNAANNAKVQ